MTAVLAMIAKAPGADVLRAMRSVIHLVDEAVLVVAPEDPLLGLTLPLPGRVVGTPWAGHAAARTVAYNLASEQSGSSGWVLMVDTRDVALPGAVAPWTVLPPSLAGMFDAYETPIDMRFSNSDGTAGRWRWYRRGHVMRAGLDLRWAGPDGFHETLVLPEAAIGRWDGLTLRPHPKPPEQRRDYEADAVRIQRTIDEARTAGVEDPRSVFYLGQSYKDAGQLDRAFAVFEHRSKMQGDREETFWAFMWLAKIAPFVFPEDHAIVLRYMHDAAAYAPDRAEPHHLLAGHLHRRSQNGHPEDEDEARIAFARARACDYPAKARYFVDVSAYDERALKKAGIPLF